VDKNPWVDRGHKTGYLGVAKSAPGEPTSTSSTMKAEPLLGFTIIRETNPQIETNLWPENLPGFRGVVLSIRPQSSWEEVPASGQRH
jgi:hypothetical protein